MQLTNKANGSFFWRESGNRLFVEIDGQPYELKYTVAQNEAYQNFVDAIQTAALEAAALETKNESSDGAALIKMAVNRGIESALDILVIAFNSKRDEKKYEKADLKEIFSENLDLIQIVAQTWVEKKLLNPSLSTLLDPHLAPGRRGAM